MPANSSSVNPAHNGGDPAVDSSARTSKLTAAGVVAVSVGNFLVCFDASAVNVALPNLTVSLHATQSTQPWFLDSYTIPLCVFLLAAGVAGDKYGVGRVYRASLTVFGVASLLCALAQSGDQFVGARILQGASASFMLPMTLSIITKGVEDQAKRTKTIGAWGVVGGFGIAFAPIIGGLTIQFVGWRWLFLVNVPICIATVILIWRFTDRSANPDRKFTPTTQLLFCVSLTCLAAALIDGGRSTFGSATVLILFGGFLLTTTALIVTQIKTSNPMVPRELFTHRPYLLVALSGGLYQLAAYGSLLALALYLQEARGFHPDTTGYVMLPFCGAWLVGNALAVKITPAIRRRSIIISALLGATGGLLVAVLSLVKSTPLTMGLTTPIGIAAGLLASMLSSEAMYLCPPDVSGVGSGVLNTSRQIGMVIAISILGGMTFTHELLTPMTIVCAAFVLVLVCCMISFNEQSRHEIQSDTAKTRNKSDRDTPTISRTVGHSESRRDRS